MMELKQARIVITGASSGIGKALTALFLAEGATVVAAARRMEESPLSAPNLYCRNCDITKSEEVDALFRFALEAMGGIDLFVANAGFAYYEQMHEATWAHIEAIFSANVISGLYCAGKMKDLHGDGPYGFVAVASGLGFLPYPGYALYCGTKAALRHFAAAYRFELRKGQRFQVVYPVAIKTAFFQRAGATALPWPVQDLETAAKAILSGIKKEKRHIYPSKLLPLYLGIERCFPWARRFYLSGPVKDFQRRFKIR